MTEFLYFLAGALIGWGLAEYYAARARREAEHAHAQVMGMWRVALNALERHMRLKFARDADGNPVGEIIEVCVDDSIELSDSASAHESK